MKPSNVARKPCKSGVTGVWWDDRRHKWTAWIKEKGNEHWTYIAPYDTVEAARSVVEEATYYESEGVDWREYMEFNPPIRRYTKRRTAFRLSEAAQPSPETGGNAEPQEVATPKGAQDIAHPRPWEPVEQCEPAENESHPDHNWKPGNTGPQQETAMRPQVEARMKKFTTHMSDWVNAQGRPLPYEQRVQERRIKPRPTVGNPVVARHPNGEADHMKAPEYLNRSIATLAQRARTYDDPDGERSIGKTVEIFNSLTAHGLNEKEGWLFMLCLKLARSQSGGDFTADTFVDLAAYAALMGESADDDEYDDDPQMLGVNT